MCVVLLSIGNSMCWQGSQTRHDSGRAAPVPQSSVLSGHPMARISVIELRSELRERHVRFHDQRALRFGDGVLATPDHGLCCELRRRWERAA